MAIVALPPVPQPSELIAGTLETRATREWFVCGPAPAAEQGWKLYVSATILNFRAILATTLPLLAGSGLQFKYIRDIETLRMLNAGAYGYSQIGKCLVIYLPRVDGELIEKLRALLEPFRDTCPTIPFAQPLDGWLPLFYRYGSYRRETLVVDGHELPDQRIATSAVPPGIVDELAPLAGRVPEEAEMHAFLLGYPAFEALAQEGKSGVFRALRLASPRYQEVVVKLGYPHGQKQPNGLDGCGFLRRERAFYATLAGRGLTRVAPRLIDSYDDGRRVILVLEKIEGPNLLTLLLENKLTPAILERAWRILHRFHRAGLYAGDAKVANFLMAPGQRLKIIDFEGAGLLDDHSVPWAQTFELHNPAIGDLRRNDLLHFLASVLFPYRAGRYSWSDRRMDLRTLAEREEQNEVEAWALVRLRRLLES